MGYAKVGPEYPTQAKTGLEWATLLPLLPSEWGTTASSSGRVQACYLRPVKVQDCCPLSLFVAAPDDSAPKEVSDRTGRKITVKIEESGIEGLVARAQIQP